MSERRRATSRERTSRERTSSGERSGGEPTPSRESSEGFGTYDHQLHVGPAYARGLGAFSTRYGRPGGVYTTVGYDRVGALAHGRG